MEKQVMAVGAVPYSAKWRNEINVAATSYINKLNNEAQKLAMSFGSAKAILTAHVLA